jgi:broad specificity phosphatase PhoE
VDSRVGPDINASRSIRDGGGPGTVGASIDLRRHSLRTVPEIHLSEAGRTLAREVGASTGPFDRVVSSPALRAVETAASMGYPDPEIDALFGAGWPEVEAVVPWPSPFMAFRRALDLEEPAVVEKARELSASLRTIARELPAGGRALVVTHGGVTELSTVALRPHDDALTWGEPCRCLEGVRITFDNGVALSAELLRLDPRRTRM